MTIAIAIVCALLLAGLSLSDAARRSRRREELLRADPLALAGLDSDPPAYVSADVLLSVPVALIVAYHLAVPSAILLLRNRMTGLALVLSAAVCAGCLLIEVHRLRDARLGLAGFALLLITLAVCVLATIFVPRDAYTFATPARVSRLIALAVMTVFWAWLARVWSQQLDEGRAWTTAGKLIPVARAASTFSVVTGLWTGVEVWLGSV